MVVSVFDAPMVTDRRADHGRRQVDLAGVEGSVVGLAPEAGFGVLVPGEPGDAGDGADQSVPVGAEPSGDVEGFDQTVLLSAVSVAVDGQGGVGGLVGGRDCFDRVEQVLLVGLELGDQEVAGIGRRLKGFFDSAWRRQ